MTQIRAVAAMAVQYPFALHFGGADKVPPAVSSPSSHFQRIKRLGQYATYVCVRDSDGHVGFGECFGLPHPKPSEILINEVIGPALEGVPLAPPDEMLHDWRTYFGALGNTRGAPMEALSGLDIAIWDLMARRAGQDLGTFLGGTTAPVATYASPIPFADHPDRAIDAARALLGLGFTGLKMKIGRDLATDLDHIRAVRAFLPKSVPLMLDANCAFTPERAAALLDALADLDIAWLEEPLPPSMLDALAALADRSPIPLAAGENEFTLDAFERLIVQGRIGIVQPNLGRAGGVSGFLAIGALAERHGAAVSPHGVGTTVATAALIHACNALPGFSVVEANRLLNPLRDNFGLDLMPDASGRLKPPAGPGHGGAPDWHRIAQFASPAAATDRFLAITGDGEAPALAHG